jgi:hypothetical protein
LLGPRHAVPFSTEERLGQMTIPVRLYAGIAGIFLLALGVIGVIARLISGSDYLFNVINVSWGANLIHLMAGGSMAYVAYKQSDVALARTVVGVLGFIYLLVFVVSLLSSTLFGLIGSGLTLTDNLVHLVSGLSAVYVAYIPGTSEQLKV